MARADFVTGLLFFGLGLFALFESLRMPRFAHLSVNPYTVPGIVPGLLGVMILALGLLLTLRAARRGGWRIGNPWAGTGTLVRTPAAQRVLITLGLTIGYAAGLVGTLPFWLATGLFVFAFIVVFAYRRGASRRDLTRLTTTALVQAVIVAVIVTLVFRYVFLVRLP